MFDFLEDLESFTKKVIPKDASETQIKEMRKAFIAGAKLTSHKAVSLKEVDFMDYIEGIDEMFEFIST